jgi:hypothetical protein
MKTNASSKTIMKAVENVSSTKYKGNVVFRKSPFNLTKNVKNFTVRTIDSNGLHLAKANWNVHQDIMNEIFRLEQDENIYVDTIYGRQYNKIVHSPAVEKQEPVLTDILSKRTYTKRTMSERNDIKKEKTLSQFLKTLKYIIKHPELISK